MEFLREYALPLLYSFGACAGFCILFNLRGKKVFFAALGGAVSWLVYLLTRGLTPAEALALTVDSFRFMAAFEGDIPGASEVECGNYRDMDLPAAKAEAAAMLPVLEALTAEDLHY